MALGNTPNRETSFAVEASKSYAFGVRFITEDGLPVDITDCVVRMVLTDSPYQGGTEVLSTVAVSEDPSSGFTWFSLQAEDLALEPGTYSYDITFLPPSGYSTPIIKGFFEIGTNTDQDSSNIYENINSSSDITVTMAGGDLVSITIERVDGLYVIVSEMMKDFSDQMAVEVAKAADSASDAYDSAVLAQEYAASMQVWLDNAGYPFWKGTYAEYQAISPKKEVLYLLVDEAVK